VYRYIKWIDSPISSIVQLINAQCPDIYKEDAMTAHEQAPDEQRSKARRRVSRRAFLRMAAASAGAMMLAACGGEAGEEGAAEPAPAGSPAAGGPVGPAGPGAEPGGEAVGAPGGETLEFWAFTNERIGFVKEVLEMDMWKSAHPDVQVNFRVFPFDAMHDRLLASLVSGQGAPDIADVEIGRFAQFIKGERVPFVALNDRIGSEIENVYRPAATDPWTWEDQIYGVGNELNTVLFAYRKDIMDELGVTTPFETWDDVIATGKQVVEAGERKMFALHDIHFGDWYMIAQHAGTTLFDDQGNYIGDNPKSVEAMQFLHDLVHQHQIAGIAPADAQNDWFGPQYWAAFDAEQFVAVWGPPWHIGQLPNYAADQSGQWTVQPFPKGIGDSRPTANHGGTGQCITEQSQKVDLAWDLIRMCNLTREGVLADFRLRTAYPAYKPAYEDPILAEPNEYFGGAKIGEIYASVAPELPPFNQSPIWPEATEAMVRIVITPVMQDRKEAQAALTELKAEIERLRG
jgi:arabinosaccharide transport system substrate-binding protein